MAEEHSENPIESMIEKISEKIHAHDSSSSDSDSEEKKKLASEEKKKPDSEEKKKPDSDSSVKDKIYRLFGRERPVHKVLGGGKPADVFLWRNKKVSAGVVGVATAIWVLFELVEYHLLSLVCHILILSLAVLFLWSNAHKFINKSQPRIPEIHIPEEPFLQVASAIRMELNQAFAILHNIATGKDLKKFLIIIAALWILSKLGTCCNFLTLFYIVFVLLHTVPVLYEKYEDKVDPFAEKAMIEIKRQYAVFDAKVLSKIPVGALKAKKI